jgi:uncharacterized membrane protein YbhN (UPF0104 family)
VDRKNQDDTQASDSHQQPKRSYLKPTEIVISLASVIIAVIANVGIEFFSSNLDFKAPPWFTVSVSVLVGVLIISISVINIFLRQKERKRMLVDQLRKRDDAFFATLENDLAALLAEEA